MNLTIEHIVDLPFRNQVGESPFWHAEQQKWYWLDQAGIIYSYMPNTQQYTTYKTEQKLGSMVLTQHNQLLVAAESDILRIDTTDCHSALHFQHSHPQMKFADGKCDRQGRFIVSTMNPNIQERQAWGNWFSITAKCKHQLAIKVLAHTNSIIPNGSAFSPTGDIFYFAETDTYQRRIFRCRYDKDEGLITEIKLHVDLGNAKLGRPDGATVDVDGCYWVCCLDNGMILRITPTGKIDKIIQTPMKKPTMCAFGGKDYKTLFITSLCRGEQDWLNDPYAGCVMMVESDYQGIAESKFKEV